jgi:hypothetical protein
MNPQEIQTLVDAAVERAIAAKAGATPAVAAAPAGASTLDLAALIDGAVTRAIAGRSAPAAPPAPAAETAEVVELRSKLANLEGTVARLAAAPVRRGLAYQTSDVSGGQMHGRTALHDLVERSRQQVPGLSGIVESTLPILVGDKAERASASDLASALSAVLRTAESEGLIGNPAPASWA